jgi:hypothetical protein
MYYKEIRKHTCHAVKSMQFVDVNKSQYVKLLKIERGLEQHYNMNNYLYTGSQR